MGSERMTSERLSEIETAELPVGRSARFVAELLEEVYALRAERDFFQSEVALYERAACFAPPQDSEEGPSLVGKSAPPVDREIERLRRAVVAVAYATLAAVDATGTLTMDLNHRESVTLALNGLLDHTRDASNPAGSYTNVGAVVGKQCESLAGPSVTNGGTHRA